MVDSQRSELDILAERLARAFPMMAQDPERFFADIGPLYSPDLSFRDPVQSLEGRDAWAAMARRVVAAMRDIVYRVDGWGTGPNTIFLVWEMNMKPKNPAPRMVVPGVTQLTVRDGIVVRHVDHWDLLGPLVDPMPIVGPTYRALVRRLG